MKILKNLTLLSVLTITLSCGSDSKDEGGNVVTQAQVDSSLLGQGLNSYYCGQLTVHNNGNFNGQGNYYQNYNPQQNVGFQYSYNTCIVGPGGCGGYSNYSNYNNYNNYNNYSYPRYGNSYIYGVQGSQYNNQYGNQYNNQYSNGQNSNMQGMTGTLVADGGTTIQNVVLSNPSINWQGNNFSNGTSRQACIYASNHQSGQPFYTQQITF